MAIIEINAVVHDGIVAVPASLEGHRIHLTIIDHGLGDTPSDERGKRFGANPIPGIRIEMLSRDQANQRP